MQSRRWVTRVTSHATLGAILEIWPQPPLRCQHLEHLCYSHNRRIHAGRRSRETSRNWWCFRGTRDHRILDECDYFHFPNIKYVQLCFVNFMVMSRMSTGHRFYEILLCIQSKWVWNIMDGYLVLNIHWFQTGTFEELIWVCEVSPGPGDGPARLMIGEAF